MEITPEEQERRRKERERVAAWARANPERRREISRAYARRNYERDKQKKMDWAKANKARADVHAQASKNRRRAWVATFKDKPCADCGGRFPHYCMDFDHRDPGLKSFTIGSGQWRRKEAVMAEIAKCDVVCANCHRIRTHSGNHAGFRRSKVA